ncbi:Chromosome transmission fidelity protein 18 [Saguinus oedipus]|uniref:Chromosome transmission fidelity protein 18 n=1 Tax=Saguinus oedipus TaxID=9490 RepID=A0ABQ9UJI1_SAGOE|nr:Chromosome transmission fidelity protein 18 [Saguinus oedipus]
MEDYEQELCGVDDDFHSQFAAELEVLAELEGGARPPSGTAFRRRRGRAARGRKHRPPRRPGRRPPRGGGRAGGRVASSPRLAGRGGRREPPLPAGTSTPSPSGVPPPPAGRPPRTFEEALAGGDATSRPAPAASPGSSRGRARKRQVLAGPQPAGSPPRSRSRRCPGPRGGREGGEAAGSLPVSPAAPGIKRPRLEVVKRLNFRSEESEGPPPPDTPPRDITPPSSPEDLAELWGHRASDAVADVGLTQASPAPRNPVLRRPPILEDYIHVTSTEGVRAFLVLRADPMGTGVQSPLPHVPWRGGGQLDLLGVSFASLKEQVDNERRQRLLQEAQQLSDTLHRSEEEEAAQAVGAPEEELAAARDASPHCLWVDEFAPQHYTELLSDDFTNRCLLKWLKLWDLVVFGRERPARKPRPSVEPARAGKEATAPGKWKSHEQVLEEMLEAGLDPSQRPRHKVALLCGPPGLGKTTLAHVIARHAGYSVVEMNARVTAAMSCGSLSVGTAALVSGGYPALATGCSDPRPHCSSDDRSPEVFRTRIEAATQMESVLGASGKPNCLVIDEIDGAPMVGSLMPGWEGGQAPGSRLTVCFAFPKAAISVLLSILNRKGPQEAELQGQAVPLSGGRRRRAEGGLLMRPIICICNDQFAPSLRQLKQQAFLLHFPPTLPSRLVQRLQEDGAYNGTLRSLLLPQISLRRGLRADPGVLAALCEKTGNDIRACMNTLQFLHSRGQRELSVRDVRATCVGLKDQRRGLFSVWQEVFQLPRAQRMLALRAEQHNRDGDSAA